jgi:glycogen(starch) synthase
MTRPGSWRVLHVLDHSLPTYDGYVFRTLGILAAQRARGWTTEHFTGPRQGKIDAPVQEIDGWRFHRTPEFAGGGLPGLREWREMAHTTRRLMQVARDLAPDVIHAHSPSLDALPALRVGRALGVPVVYEIRAFWEDAGVDQGKGSDGSPRWRAIRAFDTWLFRRVQAVTTICEGLRGDIVARGIPAEKVTVIPNAVDASRFRMLPPATATERAALGLPEASIVGFIGSLYHYEGIDLLLDAALRLRAKRPDVCFVVVGSGLEESALKARVAEAGLADSFRMLGRVPNREVERYYAAMDVMVYPRRSLRLTELVTPLKPLEAMAQGRIVMASDVGGHRELIADGSTGYLFAPDDGTALAAAVERVIDHKEAWPRMRETARRFVEDERTWTNSVARYAEVYAAARARLG